MPLSNPNYNKLKTNLRLAINRLKLLERKKTEIALKARKEIADYMSINKVDRAKIRVEHIIREDYMVEAMEIVEMLCDLLLARFGLIQQISSLDEGLKEAISSLIWVAPRLQADVPEMKIIADILIQKYGIEFAKSVRDNSLNTVNEKLIQKMSVQAPPKLLVEKYLIEIGKSHNVPYVPDPLIMKEDEIQDSEKQLLDFLNATSTNPSYPNVNNNSNPKHLINSYNATISDTTLVQNRPPSVGFKYPHIMTDLSNGETPTAPHFTENVAPPSYLEASNDQMLKNPNALDFVNNVPQANDAGNNNEKIEKPTEKSKNDKHINTLAPNENETSTVMTMPDIDYDDLNRRFDALKKKK